MQQFTLLEYEKLARSKLSKRHLFAMQHFDEQQAQKSGNTIFEWGLLKEIKAKNYVGVMQIPGLTIEILPKIETNPDETAELISGELASEQQCRQNLLYMLSQTQKIPFRERELAFQALQKLPMLEVLICLFAQRLLTELRRGQQHYYLYREDELPCVKGKLLTKQLAMQNVSRRHLMPVGFDEFANDTWLNRILKAACSQLLNMTKLSRTQQYLRESLLELADVKDCLIQPDRLQSVILDQNAIRFEVLFEFSKLVLRGSSPTPVAGGLKTFNLLFPMELLFEEFIGVTLQKEAEQFGFHRSDIHLQAKNHRRWLLRNENEKGVFRLIPDLLVKDSQGQTSIILDTKWKRLLADHADRKNGLSQADIYQLYTYAQQYECENNILLYPFVEGVTSKSFWIDGSNKNKQLRVEFIDLSYDLRTNKTRLIEQLKCIVVKGER